MILRAIKPIIHMVIGSKHGHHVTMMMAYGVVNSIATGGCIKTGEDTPGFSTIFTIAAISIAFTTVNNRKTHQK